MLNNEGIAIQGNHETIKMNERYGFLVQLKEAYNDDYSIAL